VITAVAIASAEVFGVTVVLWFATPGERVIVIPGEDRLIIPTDERVLSVVFEDRTYPAV